MTPEESNQFFEDIHDELDKYHKSVRQSVKDFTEEVVMDNPDWVAERRIEYLNSKVKELTLEANLWGLRVINHRDIIGEMIVKVIVLPIKKEIVKLKREMDIYQKPIAVDYDKKITDQDIERAKSVDCESLIESNKRWAVCPFHDDKKPSLYLYPAERGYYCFSCSASGDAIDLVRKLYNYSFQDAVKHLKRY